LPYTIVLQINLLESVAAFTARTRQETGHMITRRDFAAITAGVGGACLSGRSAEAAGSFSEIAHGPFKPDWESLKAGYKAPEWFRDAKFGLWAHWSAQCVPEAGDWYARNMYMQGDRQYDHHAKTSGGYRFHGN
jgi:alpha-L-fucosidase